MSYLVIARAMSDLFSGKKGGSKVMGVLGEVMGILVEVVEVLVEVMGVLVRGDGDF